MSQFVVVVCSAPLLVGVCGGEASGCHVVVCGSFLLLLCVCRLVVTSQCVLLGLLWSCGNLPIKGCFVVPLRLVCSLFSGRTSRCVGWRFECACCVGMLGTLSVVWLPVVMLVGH